MDFTPILDLIKTLVPANVGTKFLISLSGVAAIVYMAMKEFGTNIHIYSIVGIVVIYFTADLIGKTLTGKEIK